MARPTCAFADNPRLKPDDRCGSIHQNLFEWLYRPGAKRWPSIFEVSFLPSSVFRLASLASCRHSRRRPQQSGRILRRMPRKPWISWRRRYALHQAKNTSRAPPMSGAKAAGAVDVTISRSKSGERPGIRKSSRRLPLRRSRVISIMLSFPSKTFAPWRRGMILIWQNCRTYL